MNSNRFTEIISSKKAVRIIAVIFVLIVLIFCAILVDAKLKDSKEAQYKEILEKYANEGGLIYGADDSAPPLRFVDDDGIYKGVAVDIMNQLSLEMGIEIKCEPYKWADALENLKEGKTDMCDMFASEERARYYVFTDPIYNLRTVMVTRRWNDYTLDDIGHLKIATQKGDYANEYLQIHYPSSELLYVHDVGEALEELMSGRVDAVIGDEPVLLYYAENKNVEDRITFFGTSLYEEPVVLGIPRDEAELVPVINNAIKSLNETDSLEKIQQKWFTISTPITFNKDSTTALRVIFAGFIAVLLVALFFYLNSMRLRHMVAARTKELNGKNEELQFIFDSMPEGILLMDSGGNIINGNFTFFEKQSEPGNSNRRCEDLLGDICGLEGCGGDPGVCCKGCIVHECLEKDAEITAKKQMGARTYEIKASPTRITDLAGDEKAVLVVVRDITLDEINDKKLLQNSKMAAVGQLAAGMAHQIKNPLGVIRTQSYLLRRGKAEDEYVTNSLDYIDDSVERATSIIDNVMNFWRISDDESSEIRIMDFMGSIKALNEESFRRKNAELTIECNDDLTLRSYPESLKHIFHNLVSNGLDAVDEGGHVRIKAEEDADFVIFTVTDDGCGIKEIDMPNLYNPFFTTKEPGKGTGLGMFVIYSEIEKIGGTIEVESEEGKGTEFRISIPKERTKEHE